MQSISRGRGRRALGALATIAVCLGLTAGLAACGSSGKGAATLTIGGWGGVIDEATQKAYLNQFDAENHLTSQFVDAPGVQLARVEAQNMAHQVQWDAVDSLDGGSAYTLYAKGQLTPLSPATKASFEKELGAQKVTPFGFSHGSLGDVIVCNTDKMKTCPSTMAQFYNTKEFPQPRMFGGIEPIEAITTAEVAAGMPISQTATTPVNVKAVFKTLEALKPQIKVFWQSGEQQQQIMRSGEVPLGIMWSDRAYQLIAQGVKLKVVWTEGAYEPSFWAVLKGAHNSAEASKLLAFIASHPKSEATWAEIVHDSVPNPSALSYLPSSIASQLADNPVNLRQLATPNFLWYAQHSDELNTAYENFLRG
jgi:putative spermidine/putrescine transport system substrate-binding protein